MRKDIICPVCKKKIKKKNLRKSPTILDVTPIDIQPEYKMKPLHIECINKELGKKGG